MTFDLEKLVSSGIKQMNTNFLFLFVFISVMTTLILIQLAMIYNRLGKGKR